MDWKEFFMDFGLPFVLMVVSMIGYFKIADHFDIIDRPNERSSHSIPTIRGGGVVFLVAALLFFLWNGFAFPYLMAALLLSGTVSFIDDLITVNNRLKFGIHVLSVVLLFYETGLIFRIPSLFLIIIAIVAIGIINAYNFMDGINGMTGLYSLAVLLPLLLTEQNLLVRNLELYFVMALLVFNFFNSRKKARCFAGDVGSIGMAILIVFLLMVRIQETQRFEYIGLLLVYGIDTVYTILQRLWGRENIFKAHRKHLYQYLCNEKKRPHLEVSFFYAGLQLLVGLGIVYGYIDLMWLGLLLGVFSGLYWWGKACLRQEFL
jgi:UDP-N-acetylmuramyl pentapeptide phosphotransferase/UDP-N-acetylglucosamine-1-phosphate transferase